MDFASFTNQYASSLFVILIWTLFWKGVALWQASQRKQLTWFVLLLLINTVGILEILYLLFFKDYDLKSQEFLTAVKSFEKKYLAKYLSKLPK